ncbi:MAG TPA: hypoxanthine phosphoribosyltransferase [Planctomycetia bacterium]|nr:hypoxanthine phosphoribosyltransferase [Planctomycetia bacterium]
MSDRLEEMISAATIARRLDELSLEINEHYEGKRPLLVGVLKGCFVFLSDLARRLKNVEIDFLRVASYGAATETSGVVQFRMDLDVSVTGRHVLVVEDILDTGLTLAYLKRHIEAARPASFKTCVLLDKAGRRQVEFDADYVGFEIEDRFVVGYGLDYDERYRELPNVCVLHRE